MAERLGSVIYWIGCIIAAIFAIFALTATFNGKPPGNVIIGIMCAIAAVVAWLVGRATKYVLAGK